MFDKYYYLKYHHVSNFCCLHEKGDLGFRQDGKLSMASFLCRASTIMLPGIPVKQPLPWLHTKLDILPFSAVR